MGCTKFLFFFSKVDAKIQEKKKCPRRHNKQIIIITLCHPSKIGSCL